MSKQQPVAMATAEVLRHAAFRQPPHDLLAQHRQCVPKAAAAAAAVSESDYWEIGTCESKSLLLYVQINVGQLQSPRTVFQWHKGATLVLPWHKLSSSTKEQFALFSDHNGSLLRQQPRATQAVLSCSLYMLLKQSQACCMQCSLKAFNACSEQCKQTGLTR